jgi:hypothetical protein
MTGTEFRVNTTISSDQLEPAVSVSGGGLFAVVWTSYSPGPADIFGQVYDSAGAPSGSEFQLNLPYSQNEPDVAMDDFGEFVVVWQDNYTFEGQIQAQLFFSNSAPDGNDFLVNTSTNSYVGKPAVDSNPEGNFVVVWESFPGDGGTPEDGSSSAVIGRRYASDGNPAGTPFVVNTYTTNSQDTPDVAMALDGSFVVVWESSTQDTDGQGVFAQRYDSAGDPVGTEFQVNTYVTNDQDNPRVSVDSRGDFTIVWESYNQEGPASNDGVFGKHYSSSGVPIGTEFQVNTYTGGNQSYPAVAADNGNFVVVWEDGEYFGFETIDPGVGGGAGAPPGSGLDGDGIGVFGKGFIVFGACGNAVVEGGETCDEVIDTAGCDDDCTSVVCGDLHINPAAGEQCEPPNVGFCDSMCHSTF